MIHKTRRMLGQLRQNKGFTLVEMALVLIIIGIIIGAIVKGNDLVRSAEQKRIYTKFLGDWRLAYLNFYDRTGKILGDTYTTNAPVGPGQDGQADTSAGASAGPPTDAGRADLSDGDAAAPPVYLGLSQVGLNTPTTNVPGLPYRYRYVDSQGTAHLMDVAFAWDGVTNYNYMMINNIPAELAMAIDTMIDGEADGTTGDFINGVGGAGNEWNANPVADETDVRWRMQF